MRLGYATEWVNLFTFIGSLCTVRGGLLVDILTKNKGSFIPLILYLPNSNFYRYYEVYRFLISLAKAVAAY